MKHVDRYMSHRYHIISYRTLVVRWMYERSGEVKSIWPAPVVSNAIGNSCFETIYNSPPHPTKKFPVLKRIVWGHESHSLFFYSINLSAIFTSQSKCRHLEFNENTNTINSYTSCLNRSECQCSPRRKTKEGFSVEMSWLRRISRIPEVIK